MYLNPTPKGSSTVNVSLSSRESEVLYMMAKGLKNIEISEELRISNNTIRVHRRNLYCKLNVRKPAGAVRKGFELGYLNVASHM